jgi:hypothetical protein
MLHEDENGNYGLGEQVKESEGLRCPWNIELLVRPF